MANRTLDAANVRELEALDSDWVRAEGTPAHWLDDNQGAATTRIYPAPPADNSVSGYLVWIFHSYPAAISSGNYTLSIPACLQEYFSWSMLSEARRKESDASMPEVADHYAARVDLLEQVIQAYWGDSQ